MLNLLIEAMQEAVALDKELSMSWYFKGYYPSPYDTIHTCGTAACVLGYAALKVPGDKYEAVELLGEGLEKEISHDLTMSIISSSVEDRVEHALYFKEGEWVNEYKHLTLDDPTAQDALDYLLKVKEIVNT